MNDFSGKFQKIIIVTLLFSIFSSTAIEFVSDIRTVETMYINTFFHWPVVSFFYKENKSYDLCNFLKEEKQAICEKIFLQDHFKITFGIHLSKSAIFFDSAECQENLVVFQSRKKYNRYFPKQKMFPCYGRHDPIRTSWNVDEYFETFFISAGPTSDSLFIYSKSKTAYFSPLVENTFFDDYHLIKYVKNIDVIHLLPIIVTKEEAIDELKSRKRITFNSNNRENEVNYIREISSVSLQSNEICDLEKKKKIQLCRKIVTHSDTYKDIFVMDENFMRELPMTCLNRDVRFQYLNLPYFIGEYLTQYQHSTYYCYGHLKSEKKDNFQPNFYQSILLAEGYRDNSILLFMKNQQYSTLNIVEFAENVCIGICNATVRREINIRDIENIYIKTIIQATDKPDTLCNLPKEMKLAICEALLSYKNLKKIFFNKTAAFYLTPDCIERPLTFFVVDDLKESEPPKQKMFPCYARSDPIRTDWNIDDRFNKFFISGGPENDSIILYKKYEEITDDKYIINEIYYDIGMENFFPVTIEKDEVEEELKSLYLVSCNHNTLNIGTTLLRQIILYDFQISDTICFIGTDKQLSLCQEVLNTCYSHKINKNTDFKISECEEKVIHFDDLESSENMEIKIKVLPCHVKINPINNNGEADFSGSNNTKNKSEHLLKISPSADNTGLNLSTKEESSFSELLTNKNELNKNKEKSPVSETESEASSSPKSNSSTSTSSIDSITIYLSIGYHPNSIIIYESFKENYSDSLHDHDLPEKDNDNALPDDQNLPEKDTDSASSHGSSLEKGGYLKKSTTLTSENNKIIIETLVENFHSLKFQ